MEKDNDLRNIKRYVKQEMLNEMAYRDRFDTANALMTRNVSQLEDRQVVGTI